jgi:predicted Zn-dependent protease
VSKAQSLLRAARPNDALPLLKKALDLSPLDADTAAAYGEALFQSGQFAAATGALALAIRINPKRSAAYASLAQTLAAVGEIDWAKDSLIRYYQTANHQDVIREQLLRWRSDAASSANLKRASDLAIRALDIG